MCVHARACVCVCVSFRDTCRLLIRKSQYAPLNTGTGQRAELCKSFMLSDKSLLLEASLEKDVRFQSHSVILL